MPELSLKQFIVGIVLLALLGLGLLVFIILHKTAPPAPVVAPKVTELKQSIIGSSVEGRRIEAYTYFPAEALADEGGGGQTHLAFVGGVHGGYEYSSVLLAYKFIDYLNANQDVIPKNMTVTVIPALNPDGVYKVVKKEGRFTAADVPTKPEATVPGRFNAHEVDLNRNFDCKWQAKSMWKGQQVSAGTKAFSEPEARTLRDFVLENKPNAVIFWHSKANAVYASECKQGILPGTIDIMNAYSKASGYKAIKTFDAYAVTGDAEGWLASINVPAITVELATHESIEWDKNLAGIKALFKYYGSE